MCTLLLLLLSGRVLNLVRPAAGLLFLVFPVAIMDLLSGVFTCDWAHLDNPVALLWPDVGEVCICMCKEVPGVLAVLLEVCVIGHT